MISSELSEAVFDQPRTTLQELVAAAGQRQGLTWKASDMKMQEILGRLHRLHGLARNSPVRLSISRTGQDYLHFPHFVQDGQQTPNITGEIHVMTRWLPAEMKQASWIHLCIFICDLSHCISTSSISNTFD